jgi:hypothetical protein
VTDEQETWVRAVHETSHAVSAIKLGYTIDHVELDPQPRIVFPSEDVVAPSEQSERDLHCMAVVLMAGPVATSRLTGRPLDEVLADVGADDAEKFRVLVDASREGHRGAFRRDVMAATEEMVRREWSAILRVARILVEKRRLFGDEFAELLKPPRVPPRSERRGATKHQDGWEPLGFLIG